MALRIIRGTVKTDGTIVVGSGFTAAKVEKGKVKVSFTEAFAAVPSVEVSAAGTRLIACIGEALKGSVTLEAFNSSGLGEECTLCFLAVTE